MSAELVALVGVGYDRAWRRFRLSVIAYRLRLHKLSDRLIESGVRWTEAAMTISDAVGITEKDS